MKRRTFWILTAGVAAVAVGAAVVGAIAVVVSGSGGMGAAWASHQYLALQLGGEIAEQPADPFETLLDKPRPSLQALVRSVDQARVDPKVTAAVVRIHPLAGTGWARAQELRGALKRFRDSGKPVYAQLQYSGNKEYFLASACTKIFILPSALIDVSGLSAEVTFLRGLLDNFGVEAQFEGVGKYKNAPNQFTEKSFTAPHREQTEALLDSLFEQYVEAIADGRDMSVEEVRAAIDLGPFDAQSALDAGLVDDLRYRDEVEDGLDEAARVSPQNYLRQPGLFDPRPDIALIYAIGEIVPGASQSGPFGGRYAGSDTISAALIEAGKDDDIQAIVLRIDSPGGFGPAADAIWRAVGVARESKPVIASMGDAAASGGYYIAMGANVIVAQPTTVTGSIGVFSGKFSLRGLYDKIGLTKEIVSRGRNASLFTEYRRWEPAEREKVRALNRLFYEDFVNKAAEGRKTSYEEIHEVAQGRVWTGVEAHERGLVDRLGGMDVAVEAAKLAAGIEADADVDLVILPKPKSFLDALFERSDERIVARLPLELRQLDRWTRVLGAGAPMARLPFDIQIR